MQPNIWIKEHSSVEDTSSRDVFIQRFIALAEGEAFTVRHEVTLKSSLLDMADVVANALQADRHKVEIKSDETSWIGVHAPGVAAVVVSYDSRASDNIYADDFEVKDDKEISIFSKMLRTYTFVIAGDRHVIKELLSQIDNANSRQKYAKIKWWMRGEHGTTYKSTYLENPNTQMLPEFYPTIEGLPEEFMKQYLKSSASILLMAGPPGTGKTTFLRHMVYKYDLVASVVFDEKLMESDTVFQSFLFDNDNDILIIEDADTILVPRERNDNNLMSRFLNVSDGLIKLPNKKLVFTTNTNDFGRIDAALLRPGRCFGLVETRPLTHDEAVKAAKAAGIAPPTATGGCTLAELFNPVHHAPQPRGIGFAA